MPIDTRDDVIADARFELRVRQLAPPLMLLAMLVWFSVPSLARLGRIFLSMWLHELGHTVSAWLCGFAALPGPWRTRVPEDRSWWVLALVLLALAFVTWRSWRAAAFDHRPTARRGFLAAMAGAGLLVLWLWQLSEAAAAQLILFSGDGGAMVLGVALIACFSVRPEHYLHHTGLRWGLLAIGTAAFLDPALGWWRARDPDTIAFGHIEGVGDSDPSRLVDGFGWSVEALVSRYQTLMALCAVALVLLYARGVLAGRRLVEQEAAEEAARAAPPSRPPPPGGALASAAVPRDKRPTAGGGTSVNR